jgi:hypothetical protein
VPKPSAALTHFHADDKMRMTGLRRVPKTDAFGVDLIATVQNARPFIVMGTSRTK